MNRTSALLRKLWAIGLAVAVLAPVGVWMIVVYARQTSSGVDRVRAELELRTELLRAQLQSPYEPGALEITPDESEGLSVKRTIARVTALSNLPPGYQILLFEAGLEKALAVRGLQSDQAPAFADVARASLVPMPIDARPVDMKGAPFLVSVAPLWANGPVLVVARDLTVARSENAASFMAAYHGIGAFGLSAVALAAFAWLLAGGSSRAPPGGAEGPAENERRALVSKNGSSLELAQVVGAVNKMATALDTAYAARETDRRDRDVLEGKLRRWQVAAAVRQLTDAMADEIGSPLNTILGRARLAASTPDCPSNIRTALETVAIQAERITKLVTEMLRLTRPGRVPSGACDLAAVVDQVVGAIGPECQRANVPVTLEREPDSAYVKVDEERAFQIVVNACLSAVEAQPEGGNVTLRIRADGRESSPGRRVLLEVEDQGRPPAPTEDADASGLSGLARAIDARGFGLMIARGLLVEAGGLFELRAGARGGAVCQFTFPGGGWTPPKEHLNTRSSMERAS